LVEQPAEVDPPTPAIEAEKEVLPPAPVSVVLSGETPGPQIALSTSEPAALAQHVEEIKVDEHGHVGFNGSAASMDPELAAIAEEEPVRTPEAVAEAAPPVPESGVPAPKPTVQGDGSSVQDETATGPVIQSEPNVSVNDDDHISKPARAPALPIPATD